MPNYVAVDLGAGSGRVLTGEFDGERLAVEETHRFSHRPSRVGTALHCDTRRLLAGIREGLARAAARGPVTSVGVDAWGNDFGLLDRDGELLADPRYHRDPYAAGMVGAVSSQEHYRVTGIQPLPINASCQLLAQAGTPLLDAAERLIMLPDLFAYRLSGERFTERTIASTTQLLDARTGRWATGLIEGLGLPSRLFAQDVVEPGTVVGPLRGESRAGSGGPRVVAVASHDTASAVAAIPFSSAEAGFVSCGTWSLVGVETGEPVTTPEARLAGFSNEGGVRGTVRLLRNLNGLWLLQECRRVWGARDSYAELAAEAAQAPPFGPLIDPAALEFLRPGDMPARVARFCRATGQAPPDGRAATVRCVLESLACSFRLALEQAERLSGRRVRVVHLVGGGASNAVLCRLTADFCGKPVLAGPVEATGIGNLLVQAMADGRVGSLAELREVVRRSFRPREFLPDAKRDPYETAYARFKKLTDSENFWSKIAGTEHDDR